MRKAQKLGFLNDIILLYPTISVQIRKEPSFHNFSNSKKNSIQKSNSRKGKKNREITHKIGSRHENPVKIINNDVIYQNQNNPFGYNNYNKMKVEKSDNINHNKKIEKEDTLSKISDNSNRNKKLNLINLITTNNNNLDNGFRQKILKNNYNFKKKVDLINDKIQQILQTDANEYNNKKIQNDINSNLKKLNLFNYKNNNKENIGKQNIYEERFQNKNNGYFLYLKKNNQNSINSIENTASNSHNKTKKFFTQFVTPIANNIDKKEKLSGLVLNTLEDIEYRTKTLKIKKKLENHYPQPN